MKKSAVIVPFAFLGMVLVSSSTLRAALVMQFSDDGGSSFANSFQVTTGDSLSLGIFLTDTDGVAGVLNNDGLFGFGLAGDVIAGNTGSIVNATPNTDFDFVNSDLFTSTTVRWDVGIFQNAIPKGTSISLGSFQFNPTSAGTTTFAWSDIQPGSGSIKANWLSGIGVELDEMIFGSNASNSFALNVTSIPEPSPCYIFFVLAIGCAGCCWARRQLRVPGQRGRSVIDVRSAIEPVRSIN